MTPRRAALLATAVVLPLVLVLALLFTNGRDGSDDQDGHAGHPLSEVTVAAPPAPDAATTAACTALIAALPIQLNGLDPRRVDSSSSFVVAWGDPAVVLRCGVARPAELVPSSAAFVTQGTGGVNWLTKSLGNGDYAFTAIDRTVYVELTEPEAQRGVAFSTVSAAIAKAMPTPVCYSQDSKNGNVPEDQLCTRRP